MNDRNTSSMKRSGQRAIPKPGVGLSVEKLANGSIVVESLFSDFEFWIYFHLKQSEKLEFSCNFL